MSECIKRACPFKTKHNKTSRGRNHSLFSNCVCSLQFPYNMFSGLNHWNLLELKTIHSINKWDINHTTLICTQKTMKLNWQKALNDFITWWVHFFSVRNNFNRTCVSLIYTYVIWIPLQSLVLLYFSVALNSRISRVLLNSPTFPILVVLQHESHDI